MFLKKLIFKNEEESDFKSKKFDGFKYSVFLGFIVLIATEIYMIERIYILATQNIALSEQITSCKK